MDPTVKAGVYAGAKHNNNVEMNETYETASDETASLTDSPTSPVVENPIRSPIFSKATNVCTQGRRTVFALVVLFLMAGTALLFATVCLVMQCRLARDTSEGGIKSQINFCLPCDKLRLTSDPVDDVSGLFERQGDICCARSDSQVAHMQQLLARKAVREELSTSMYRQPSRQTGGKLSSSAAPSIGRNTSSPGPETHAAFVFLRGPLELSEHNEDFQLVKEFNTGRDVAYIRKGVELVNRTKRFRVAKSGLYQISVQLAYLNPAGSGDNSLIYSTRIYREHPRFGADIILQDTAYGLCQPVQNGYPCYSSKLNAVPRLRLGDEIYISVLHKELLIADGRSSFFGIVFVGQ